MKYTIFYSWQSDLPNNTNRSFLESVMETAIKDFKNNDRYELEPSIDRDTKDMPGSPNITQALIDKIKTSDAFVADISIVTGDKEKGQRPSPNPNVMLELGYAIALLGWDRIILFCNELYGKDEDLPFDIRQHRQIKYFLASDDQKAELKKNLSQHFGKRLIELVEHGKASTPIKEPMISAQWNFWDIALEGSDDGVVSDIINLERSNIPLEIENEVRADIERAKNIDGSFDPRWEEKLRTYVQQAEFFLEEKQKLKNTDADIIINNVKNVNVVTLSVDNSGNAKATDIRIEVELPEWILAFEKFPDFKNEKPEAPTPKRPTITDSLDIFKQMKILPSGAPLILPNMRTNITAACYLQDKLIKFWADDLLHKHTRTIRNDTFYLLASPEAPIGESIIKGRVFCSEFEDWKELNLKVLVTQS